MKLSAIIIAKNAQDQIEDCLKSVSFCDEIIVIDGGSMDSTIEIAKKYHAKIVTSKTDSFAEKRNEGLHHAKGEWVLYVDTDERVSLSLREGIIQSTSSLRAERSNPENIKTITKNYRIASLKNGLARNDGNGVVAFKLKRKNFYFGNHEWPQVEHLERLFKKDSLKGWYGVLHESPIVSGEVGELEGFLLHYTHRNLSSILDKTIQWSAIEAKLRFENNHPPMTWWRFPRVMMTAFYDSYIKQKGYQAGTAGLVESIYQAFSMFITYARLWEMQKKFKNQNAKVKITK